VTAPYLDDLIVGQALPEQRYKATEVSLFMYNAAVWNPHRIHYDRDYTVDVEGHPEIVIDGPLQGDWLSQVVLNWVRDAGALVEFTYTNRQAAYLGETLCCGGSITAIDTDNRTVAVDLYVRNEADEIVTPGSAVVRFA
jgi:3-methylfumaryl-CoA hydratase